MSGGRLLITLVAAVGATLSGYALTGNLVIAGMCGFTASAIVIATMRD